VVKRREVEHRGSSPRRKGAQRVKKARERNWEEGGKGN